MGHTPFGVEGGITAHSTNNMSTMPNLHVTDRQVMIYMTRSRHLDQEAAAATAGFSARTARRIDKDPRLPSLSLSKVFDVGTRENRSRYMMFPDLFSSVI